MDNNITGGGAAEVRAIGWGGNGKEKEEEGLWLNMSRSAESMINGITTK